MCVGLEFRGLVVVCDDGGGLLAVQLDLMVRYPSTVCRFLNQPMGWVGNYVQLVMRVNLENRRYGVHERKEVQVGDDDALFLKQSLLYRQYDHGHC
jgi:hypothetical protein